MRSLPSGWNRTLAALGLRKVEQRKTRAGRLKGRSPRIEALEPRQMLSITVNTLVDENNGGDFGAGRSLREALAAVTSSNDEIDFDPSLDGGMIKLELGELVVNQAVTITGPGWNELTIDAQGSSRVLNVADGVESTISGLSITGGRVDDSAGSPQNTGGGIHNSGELTLIDVRIYGNQTDFADAAGHNSGGGVYSLGKLHIEDSWIHDNQAKWGGGVFAELAGNETFTLIRSTVSHNVGDNGAGSGGGGGVSLAHDAGSGAMEFLNSTISNNASPYGGGVRLKENASHVTIVNSTIAQNHAAIAGGGLDNDGGSKVTLYNSIVSENTSPSSADVRSSNGTTGSNNKIGDPDVDLLPLHNYGGFAPTHALTPTSSAIDVALNTKATQYGLTVDQRGNRRQNDLIEVDNLSGEAVDAGAFELGEPFGKGDFNGDGRPDRLFHDRYNFSVNVLAESATGGYEMSHWGHLDDKSGAADWDFAGAIVGDFDGDGRDDFWMRDQSDDEWSLVLSDGSAFHGQHSGSIFGTWQTAEAGDFDGDGSDELMVRTAYNQPWQKIDFSPETGILPPVAWNYMFGTASWDSENLHVGDFNGDGIDDFLGRSIVAGNPWSLATALPGDDGSGQFVHQGVWGDIYSPEEYDVADNELLDAAAPYREMVEAFAAVRNNVELELYAGFMKGPDATRATQAGNPFDQAALLLEELRALPQVEAHELRLAIGDVRAPIDAVQDWLGVRSAIAAKRVIEASLDDNVEFIDSQGETTPDAVNAVSIQFKHAWVRLQAPTDTGIVWIDLDPSWKFKDRQPGIDVGLTSSLGAFDELAYLSLEALQDQRLPVEFFEDQVIQKLVETSPGASLADVPFDGPILFQTFSTLPVGMGAGVEQQGAPAIYEDLADVADSSASSEAYTHRFRLRLVENPGTGEVEHWATEDLVVAEYATTSIEVTYAPTSATLTDPDEIATGTSFWSRLVMDGVVDAQAKSTAALFPTDNVIIEIEHLAPETLRGATTLPTTDSRYVGPTDVDQRFTFHSNPGDFVSIALDANQNSQSSLASMRSDLLAAIDANGSTEANFIDDIDDLASYAGAKYWYDFNHYNRAIEGMTESVGVQPWVGSGIVTAEPALLQHEGSGIIDFLPYGMSPVGFGVDLPNATHDMADIDTGLRNSEAWQLGGYNSSALEHGIVEEVISAESISTMKGVQRASHRNLGLNAGGNPSVTGGVETNGVDDIFVFVSTVSSSGTTIEHVENWRQHATNPVVAINASVSSIDYLTNASTGKLKSHAGNSGFGQAIWDALNPPSTEFEGIIRILVPEYRTNFGQWTDGLYEGHDEGRWTGGVFIREAINVVTGNRDASFIIDPDDGPPSSGGFSNGKDVTSWSPNLPQGSYLNAAYAGDPVNVANGNMYRDETDILAPNIGVPRDFTRHYDSLNQDDFGLGVGWMHSFGDVLYEEVDPEDSQVTNLVWLDSKGQRYVFRPEGSTYAVPNELHGELEYTPNPLTGSIFFVFKSSDGLVHRFQKINAAQAGKSVVGRLNRIMDRNDDGVIVVYESGTNHRRISYVRDVHYSGRKLDFTYIGGDWLRTVASSSSSWLYIYNILGSGDRQLFQVKAPSVSVVDNQSPPTVQNQQPKTQYDYHADGDLGDGMISKITEPDGAWHEYEYLFNGRLARVTQGAESEATADGDVQTFDYNLIRNRTDFVDERGNRTTYHFQDNGLTSEQIHADRTRQRFTWGDADSTEEFLMTSMTDEVGAVETFTYYDSAADPWHRRLETSTERHYVDSQGDAIDEFGEAMTPIVTEFEYSSPSGNSHIANLAKTTFDAGAGGQEITTEFEYDSVGRLLSTTDPLGNATTRTYYTGSGYIQGLLKTETRPEVEDAAGNPVSYVNTFDHDAYGNLRSTETSGTTTSYQYHAFGGVKQLLDATGVAVETLYDAMGRPKETGFGDPNSTIDPLDEFTARYQYDARGRVRIQTDPLGRATQFLYDDRGNVTQTTFADGTVADNKYDGFGNLVAQTDQLGRTTRFAYDDRNRLIQTIHADGSVQRLRYDGAGRITATINELGDFTTLRYDAAGRLLETAAGHRINDTGATIDDDLSAVTTHKYDMLGNRIETIDPEDNVTQFRHDAVGRVVQTRTLSGVTANRQSADETPIGSGEVLAVATTEFDAGGRVQRTAAYNVIELLATATVTEIPDATDDLIDLLVPQNSIDNLVQTVETRYDAFDRPVKVIRSVGAETLASYDDAGRVATRTDERGHATTFAYDDFGRLESTTLPDPDGATNLDGGEDLAAPTTSYQYDAVGNQVAATDPRGFTTQFEYDVLNRLTGVENALGERESTIYNATGQAIAAIDALGRAAYTHLDERGRPVLLQQADPDGDGPQTSPTTRQRFDAAGNRIALTDARGYESTFHYDSLGRLVGNAYLDVQVVDDDDPGFEVVYGAELVVDEPDNFAGDSVDLQYDGLNGRANWQFYDVPAGNYAIFATWTGRPDAADQMISYLYSDNGTNVSLEGTAANLDQTKPANDAFTFEGDHWLGWEMIHADVQMTEPNLERLFVRFTGNGEDLHADAVRLVRVVENQFAYDLNGNLISQTDVRGHETTWQYDELNRVVSEKLPDPTAFDGGPLDQPQTTTEYDSYGNVAKQVEDRGGGSDERSTAYDYDRRNRLVKETYDQGGAEATVTGYQYDDAGNLTLLVEADGDSSERETSYDYDNLNRTWRETRNAASLDRGDQRIIVTRYDDVGNLVETLVDAVDGSVGDHRDIQTTWEYDALGRVVAQIDSGNDGASAQQRTTNFFYDAVGNVLVTTDPLGRIASNQYDRLDRLTQSSSPGVGVAATPTTTFSYDPAGNLVAQTTGDGQTDRFYYDALGNPTRAVDGLGHETLNQYDQVGNLVAVVDPKGNETTFRYDELDRLVEETIVVDGAPLSRKYRFDNRGLLKRVFDRDGRVREYGYDRLDRVVTEKWYPDGTTGTSDYTDILYWEYDELGRVIETRTHDRMHDGSQWVLENRTVNTYQYDGLDRLTEWSNFDGSQDTDYAPDAEHSYAYALAASDGYGSTTRTQKVDGQLVAQTTYAFGPFGQLRKIEEQDLTGGAVTFGDFEAEFSYADDGRLAWLERRTEANGSSPDGFDNAARTEFTFDGSGRLAGLDHSYRTPASNPAFVDLLDFTFDYDAASRIDDVDTTWNTSLTALSNYTSSETNDFTFDDAGQLATVSSDDSSDNAGLYGYDAGGNRNVTTVGGLEQPVHSDHNRLEADDSYTYQYDNEGNLTRRDSTADDSYDVFTWDHRNRLAQFAAYDDSLALVKEVWYHYDAADRLVYREEGHAYSGGSPGSTTDEYYAHDGGRRTLTVADPTDNAGDVSRRYTHGPTGELLFDQAFDALGAETDLLSPLGDHQHSARLVLDEGMTVRQSVDYDPFGEVNEIRDGAGALVEAGGEPDLSALETAYAHHGSLLDDQTGLHLKSQRWYDPQSSKFVSEDPTGHLDGPNLYRFAGNDPVNYADPSGLSQAGHPFDGIVRDAAFGGFSGGRPRQQSIDFDAGASLFGGGRQPSGFPLGAGGTLSVPNSVGAPILSNRSFDAGFGFPTGDFRGSFAPNLSQSLSYDVGLGSELAGLNSISLLAPAQLNRPAMVLVDPRELARERNRINDPVLSLVNQSFAATGNLSRSAGNRIGSGIEYVTSGYGGTAGNLLAGLGGGLGHLSRSAGGLGAAVDLPRTFQAAVNDVNQSIQVGIDQGFRLGVGNFIGTNQIAQAYVGYDFAGESVDRTALLSEGVGRLGGAGLGAVGPARLLRTTPGLAQNAVRSSVAPAARNLPQLNVLNSTFVPNTQRVLQKVVNQAYADISANPRLARTLLSDSEYRQLVRSGPFADAQFGNAIERHAARIIRGNSSLNSILIPASPARFRGRFVRSNDFVGIEPQRVRGFDLTTIGQVSAKLNKPGARAVEFVIQPGRGAIRFK